MRLEQSRKYKQTEKMKKKIDADEDLKTRLHNSRRERLVDVAASKGFVTSY